MKLIRFAAWCGFAFVLLSGVIVVLSPFWPPLGASSTEIVEYYRAHRMPFLVGNLIAIAAAIPSFAQIAVLCLMLKKAEGEDGWIWMAVLGLAILAHAAGLMALMAYQVVPFQLDAGQEAVAKGFNDFAGVAFACFILILSGFLAFVSWGIARTQILPKWFALSGLVLAIPCFAASAGALVHEPRWIAGGGIATASLTSLFFLWCGVLSALFLRRSQV